MEEYDPSLARMIVTLMSVHEQEWARIARILHDEVGQTMSAAGLQLDLLRMDFQDKAPGIEGRTAEIQQTLERVITQVRDLSYELNPAVAEKVGFHFAMERLIGRYREKFKGTLRLMVDLPQRLRPEAGAALYKIADQALSNAVRHSGCQQIEVIVKPSPKGTVLEVADQGKGFDLPGAKDRSPGLGLLLMEYHASQAGIQLSIMSNPGKGTVVRALYPSSAEARKESAGVKA